MNFTEKKQAYQKMQNPAHLCCDHELLTKKAPDAFVLKMGIVDQAKAQREILWALLDVATVEEIESYRKPDEKLNLSIAALSLLLSYSIPSTKEGLKEYDDSICELMDQVEKAGVSLPDELQDRVSLAKKYLSDAMVKIQFTEKLIAMDLAKATQPQLASITRSLKLETPNYTAATLRIVLDDYRFSLPKFEEASEEEKIPVEAHLEVVNELTEENEQLKGELEEKELENEDLQEQLDDAEAEKELLEEELEEEKKSEVSPDLE